jgi:hypothetical protein
MLSGVFKKLRKAAINTLVSVCLSVRMEGIGPQWTDLHEI